jgi:acyl carrier protein
MTGKQIREVIIDIIQELLEDEDSDLSRLQDDARIRDQVEIDYMDFLDIIMELRKRFRITVPEEDFMKLSTMNGCIDYLEPLLKDK